MKRHVADGGVTLSMCLWSSCLTGPCAPWGPHFPLVVPISLLAGLVPEAVWTLWREVCCPAWNQISVPRSAVCSWLSCFSWKGGRHQSDRWKVTCQWMVHVLVYVLYVAELTFRLGSLGWPDRLLSASMIILVWRPFASVPVSAARSLLPYFSTYRMSYRQLPSPFSAVLARSVMSRDADRLDGCSFGLVSRSGRGTFGTDCGAVQCGLWYVFCRHVYGV